MLTKMEALLNAIVFLQKFSHRKITVGEVARSMKKPQSTIHRHMVKACGLGLVQSHEFKRGKVTCYEFSLTTEGNIFLNSFAKLF